MSERFVFVKHPSLQTVLDRLETPKGLMAIGQMVGEFTSLVDALNNTSAVGSGTVVHLPDGNNIGFVNVPKHEFAVAAHEISVANGYTLS